MLYAQNDLRTARTVIGSVVVVNLATTLPISLSIIALFPLIFEWTRLDLLYRVDAFYAVVLVCITFELGQLSLSWQYIYQSLQRYDLITGLATYFGLLSGVSGIVVLRLAPSMTAIMLTGLGVAALRLLCDAYCSRRLLGGVPLLGWQWEEVRPMLKFGGWTYLGAVGGLLFTNADRLVLTTFLGSAALPYYTVPQRLYQQIHSALAGQLEFLFPMFSALGNNATAEMQRVEDRLRWFIALASVIAYGGLALVGPFILRQLISPEFSRLAALPLYLVCIQGFLNAQNIIPFYTSWAIGSGAPNAISQLANGCLTLITAWILIPIAGYSGASLAQLWIGVVVLVQIIWVRRIIYPSAANWSWLKSYVSPLAMLLVWIGIAALGTIITQTATEYFVIVFSGGLIGLAVVWYLETEFFTDAGRWSTLQRAADIPLRRLKGRVNNNQNQGIIADKPAIE